MPDLVNKLQDSAHELFNFVVKWNKLHTSGLSTMNVVQGLKMESLRRDEISYCQMYPQGLDDKCQQLETIADELETNMGILQLLTQQLDALCRLDKSQNGRFSCPFASWSTNDFRSAFQAINEAYSKELALKVFLKEEVAHCSSKDLLLMHVLAWEAQPFITTACNTMCDKVFVETGIAQIISPRD